jgi:hypothetical protein
VKRGNEDADREAHDVASRVATPLAVLVRATYNYRCPYCPWAMTFHSPDLHRSTGAPGEKSVRILEAASAEACHRSASDNNVLPDRLLKHATRGDLAHPPPSPLTPPEAACAPHRIRACPRSLAIHSRGLDALTDGFLNEFAGLCWACPESE